MADINNGFIKIANELFDEILHRDFTPRQRSVIDLIMRLSYGCLGGKACIIDKMSCFDAAGIRRQHIRETIESLIRADVIRVNGDVYAMNKYPEQWKISYKTCASQERLKKLIHNNLKNVTATVTQDKSDVTATVTNNDKNVTATVTPMYPPQLHDEQSNGGNHLENGDLNTIKDNIKDRERDTESERLDTPENLSLSNPYDDLLKHWNGTIPKDDKLRVCAPVTIYSEPARMAVKRLFDAGVDIEDMKQAAANIQDSIDRGATWPDSPMRIGVFFRDTYQSYMPDVYKVPKEKAVVQKYPDFHPTEQMTDDELQESREVGIEMLKKVTGRS